MNKFRTVLLIDDDPINNFISYAVLSRAKIVKDIQIEKNGANALIFLEEYYSRHRSLPELIFLDLNMPVMNGFQFVKEFNSKFSLHKEKSAIIILSAFITEREKTEAAKLGVSNLIIKPLSEEILYKLILKELKILVG